MSLWGLSGAAVQGLMTRHVQPSEQGQLQGANSSLRGIMGMIGPGLFTMTFATFIAAGRSWQVPGAPFLVASLLLATALLMAWKVTKAGALELVPGLEPAPAAPPLPE
jgi:DHA1 family tetracycline resistance protein-like MFS transporter